MIYLTIFWEFLKIGLFAVGGGLVTIPFLFDLTEKYDWFSKEELADMIGVSQSLPGALGVNVAIFAGIKAAGLLGGIAATVALVIPAIVIIVCLANLLRKHKHHPLVAAVFSGVRAAVVALILMATMQIARISIFDIKGLVIAIVFLAAMQYLRKGPVFYIVCGAVAGLVFNL